MVSATFSREIEVACQLARLAGKAIMVHYATDFAVEYKNNDLSNPVTQADKQANSIIVDGLAQAFPDDGILAEESADNPERHRRQRLWCVDPIDGTREFVARNGQFVVMIGLAVAGVAEMGVVFQPTENRLFWGSGNEAFMEDARGRHPLHVSTTADANEATIVVSRSHPSKVLERIAKQLGAKHQLPIGSVGLKVAELALASADVYVSPSSKTHEWDACGPEAILKAAGGRVSDSLGAPLRYNKTQTNTPNGIVGSNGLLHDACLASIRAVFKSHG